MNTYYPVTIRLAPSEYEALRDFCQLYANRAVQLPIASIWNADLVLAQFYARTFSYARQQVFTAPKRRTSGKRYPLKMGLLYARLLHTHLQHRQQHTAPLLCHVYTELSQVLTNAGDQYGPGQHLKLST